MIEGDRIDFGFDRTLLDKFEDGVELGRGGFGQVRLVKDRATGIEYACKSIPKVFKGEGSTPPDRQDKHIRSIRNEVTALMRLRGESVGTRRLHLRAEDL